MLGPTHPQHITDRQARPLLVAALAGIANPAGGSAGESVAVAIDSFVDALGQGTLPGNAAYSVQVEASQACFTSVSNKTTSGPTITISPVDSSSTIAAGTLDIAILA